MKEFNQKLIKQKILSINPLRWWGDDFDVRFYLIYGLKKVKNKIILDIGGGIGIIGSELDKNNLIINMDTAFDDLKICQNFEKENIQNICASMTHLPFKDISIDHIICCNLLEVAKEHDLKNKLEKKKDNVLLYPTIEKTLREILRIMQIGGKVSLTTPNNAYYNSTKLTYEELKLSLSRFFQNFQIYFYNTHHKTDRSRKFNLSNITPKIKTKFQKSENIIINLLKKSSVDNFSKSFFVEANKSENNF